MDRPVVVIAETIAAAGVDRLQESCEVDLAAGVDRDELLGRLERAEGLVVRSATQVDAAMIAAAPKLRVIGRAGIGVDNIDLEAATAAGILVVNAPQANVVSAAEHTLALLLAQARHVSRADASLRAGSWDRKAFQGVELHGKTLGVLGLGRVGTLVAQRAAAFGMRLLAYDPYVGEEWARRLGVELAALDRVLAESDFISVHLPLTRDTDRLLDVSAFARMKPGVRIVNTSRGGIIDEAALAAALEEGRVAGVSLDVFAEEPLTDSPLFRFGQVVVTPHLGASTREAQDKAGIDVAVAVAAALRGELVPSAVNVDLGRDVSDEVRPYLPLAESLGRAFVALARGLPRQLRVRSEGRLAEDPVRPLALAALKGALQAVSETPVSFVNAPLIAERRGIEAVEESSALSEDFVSRLVLTGQVGERLFTLAGSVLERKGPALVQVHEHQLELPLSRHLLIVDNEDVPGVIGVVGTYLGEAGVNIADMVVGRAVDGAVALMGMSLDQPLDDRHVEGLRALPGVADARFVDLS